MKILVINCGSSSLKYQLIDMKTEEVMAKGNCEKIGLSDSFHKHKTASGVEARYDSSLPTHLEAVKSVLASLTDEKVGVIKSLDEIDAVGHRIVQGGSIFKSSVIIDEDVIEKIQDLGTLAPLHNPAHVIGIRACKEVLPNVPMVAVFDTSFHQTMPEKAYMYGLPYEMCETYQIRKYGAHGTSHHYVAMKTAEMLGKKIEDTKIIVCHLGNGSSITAVKGGVSVDTTMGFTPLDGLMMGTRCGSIDPAIIPYIVKNCGIKVEELNDFMNKKCGMQGISGVSSDFRDLWIAAEEGNKRAKLALDMFIYQVKRYIGAYIAVLNGVDAIVFTAGVGENDYDVRRYAIEGLENLGIEIDVEKNNVKGKQIDVTGPNSKVKVFVIPTNEELMIAKETMELVRK